MRRALSNTFFRWISFQTVAIFLGIGLVVFLFNLKEMHEHPDLREEEAEEGLIVAGVMLALLPFAVGSAWWITRRLLQPLQEVAQTAERISSGQFDERIGMSEPDDEIARLSNSLDGAFDRYQDTLHRLERVSYGVAHQLRNPLAAIRATGEVCLRSPREPKEYEETIGSILEDADRLNRMVEQLLLLAGCRPEALEQQSEAFNLTELSEELLREAALVAEAQDLTLEHSLPTSPLTVVGVRNLIGEAFGNLLDNALKFTPSGGRVRVELAQAADGAIRVAISDSGPGVSPEQKSVLFKPYRRDQALKKDGVGLGLVIVADIVRAHRGTVGMDDADGGGSTFWFELPTSVPTHESSL